MSNKKYCTLFLDEHLLNEILERLSVSDNNSKAFYIVLTILSVNVDSESIIKYIPNIAERLLKLMKINNSVNFFFCIKHIYF